MSGYLHDVAVVEFHFTSHARSLADTHKDLIHTTPLSHLTTTKQPSNQPINQSNNQSINQQLTKSINYSFSLVIRQPAYGKSKKQSSDSTNLTANDRQVCQSISQPYSYHIVYYCISIYVQVSDAVLKLLIYLVPRVPRRIHNDNEQWSLGCVVVNEVSDTVTLVSLH